jgi:integral membrane protein (TIGR01906 family)
LKRSSSSSSTTESRDALFSKLFALFCLPALPLVLAMLDVRLLASATYIRLAFGRAGFPDLPGFSPEERLALAQPSTRFIVDGSPPEALAALQHQGRPLYTADEIAHLVDVQVVVSRLEAWALAAALILALAGWIAWRRGHLATWSRALARSAWFSLALLALLVPVLVLAFDQAFTVFHGLLFAPGTWQFPAESYLIQLFPERFWYDTALVACALLVAETLGLAWLARRLRDAGAPLKNRR